MCEPPPCKQSVAAPTGLEGPSWERRCSASLTIRLICSSLPSKPWASPSYTPGIVPSALTGKAEKPGLHSVTAHLCPSVSCDRVPAHRQKYRAEYRGQGTDFSLWGKQKNLAASLDFLLTFHMLGRWWRGFVHNSIYFSEPPPCQ